MVGRAEIDARRELPAVRQQVGVAQHDPFRRALRARGEQDHSRVGGGDAEPAMPRRGDRAARRGRTACRSGRARARRSSSQTICDRFGQRRRQGIELRQLDEAARGDDEAQPGGAAGRQHGVQTGAYSSASPARGRSPASARKSTPAAIEFGSMTPTARPRAVRARQARPSTRLATISAIVAERPPVGSAMIGWRRHAPRARPAGRRTARRIGHGAPSCPTSRHRGPARRDAGAPGRAARPGSSRRRGA